MRCAAEEAQRTNGKGQGVAVVSRRCRDKGVGRRNVRGGGRRETRQGICNRIISAFEVYNAEVILAEEFLPTRLAAGQVFLVVEVL